MSLSFRNPRKLRTCWRFPREFNLLLLTILVGASFGVLWQTSSLKRDIVKADDHLRDSVRMVAQKTDETSIVQLVRGRARDSEEGVAGVVVCLCDDESGLPLDREYRPMPWGSGFPDPNYLAITRSDDQGQFEFLSVPAGQYRVLAQQWVTTEAFKGVFQTLGPTIRLFAPRSNAARLVVSAEPLEALDFVPRGTGEIEFDQRTPNDDTFMLLSLTAPEFDPVLGFHSLGREFLHDLVGAVRMPKGKTRVLGAPDQPVHVFFFAADNQPGFATVSVEKNHGGRIIVPKVPFVASWSDGRKTPPEHLAALKKRLDSHGQSVQTLLRIPEISAATLDAHQQRMAELSAHLADELEMPWKESVRIGDLLAVDAYAQLQRNP